MEDCLNNSIEQSSSEDKNADVVNIKLQRNLGFVDSPLVKDKEHDKAGNDLAAVFKDGDTTPLKVPEQACTSVKEANVDKMASSVSSGNEKKGASLEGAAPWVPEEATYNAPEEPCLSAKATDSSEISTDSQKLEKDKTTVLTQRGSEKVPAKDKTTKSLRDLLGVEKVSSKAPVKEGPNVPNSKFTDKRKEWLQLTTVRGVKKASAITSESISKTPPLSFNKNSLSGSANLSVNISEKNGLEGVASEAMEIEDTPSASQKPSLSSEVKPVIATNCSSLFSSNSADLNGEVFAGEGLKTYSKKAAANKRKSISRENSVEDNSTVSKVLKMDNKESSEVDHMKKIIHENSKVELAKRLNKKLGNSQPEEQTLNRLPPNSVTSAERGKASRKKSTDENKVKSSKKAKCEENKSDSTSADAVQHKPVTRFELKANTTARTEDDNLVDSVSFVADQVVDEVSVNHSPTVKDMPSNQFEAVEANNQRLNSRSRERIREMTLKKKELKAKEDKRRERKRTKASEGLTVTNKEPEITESLETVVESVLDEEIPVIYNAEGKCLVN